MKPLRVEDGLIEELSRCLRLEGGELPLELLPELQELTYVESRDTGDHSSIPGRTQAAVTLVRRSPRPSVLKPNSKAPAIASASGEDMDDTET